MERSCADAKEATICSAVVSPGASVCVFVGVMAVCVNAPTPGSGSAFGCRSDPASRSPPAISGRKAPHLRFVLIRMLLSRLNMATSYRELASQRYPAAHHVCIIKKPLPVDLDEQGLRKDPFSLIPTFWGSRPSPPGTSRQGPQPHNPGRFPPGVWHKHRSAHGCAPVHPLA